MASSKANSSSDLKESGPQADDPAPSGAKQPSRWSRFPLIFTDPPGPPTGTLDDAKILPEAHAGLIALLTFGWITPLFSLGYLRPLEATDLYKLQDERGSARIGKLISESFERRRKVADQYNQRLANGEIKPGFKTVWWTLGGKREEREKEWREKTGKQRASLVWAMNDAVKWWFWSGAILKIIADTAQLTSPLVVKEIIKFATASYAARSTDEPIPGIGKGVGLAFGLLGMQIVASLCMHHFFYRSTSTGVLLRGGLITSIYNRSMQLTSRARSKLTNGLLMNHISTDVSRVDFSAGFFHMGWTAPVQLAICLILLILQIGPSALVGFALFVILTPTQTVIMKQLFVYRRKSMMWTDKRAKLLQELLNGMKILKYNAWETPYLERIGEYRSQEMNYIWSLLLLRSANNAVAISVPTLAAVLSFITYSLVGHELDAARIFTALTLFNLLRMPLMMLPMSLSTSTDAYNAIKRLQNIFEAEVFEDERIVEEKLDVALEVKGATFSWDAPPPDETKGIKSKKKSKSVKDEEEKSVDRVFKMEDVSMSVPYGKLVAIVGAVGSGKTSLLQGIIGEMRKTKGTIKFAGSVSYCPQTAWIQNATIRENVCFGRPFEEQRYWDAIKASCLEQDLDMLPDGDQTEVGERGISLSGGQKQRLNICRAIYCDTEIQIFDDPLSALDAHVGKSVFHNVLANASTGKTRILVTHALHFLPEVDYIYNIVDGRISEQGKYDELLVGDGAFARYIREFGSKEQENEKEEEEEEDAIEDAPEKAHKQTEVGKGAVLMQKEERNTGAITGKVYKEYLKAANGAILVPLILASLALMQGSQVMASYWLVFWQEMTWDRPQGFYMGIYGALGGAQAISTFFMGSSFATLTYFASRKLHGRALERVMHAPMSFFDTTPLGRIMNRFAKDIDTIDNVLIESMRMFASTFTNIIGAVILIAIVLPWFLIAVFVVMFVYILAANFYRASARELKRLDAVLRSTLYAHFSESLSGLATIRAYGEVGRFQNDNMKRMDIENRAYWLTVTNQRWLGIRLDFLGALLTFSVAILTVATRFSISPAQTGLTLSYILSIQQAFGWLVRQTAEVENDMNSVERVIHYAHEIEQEAPYEIPENKPPVSWPSAGRVELKDLVLKYRPELPPVLKGISMTINEGEKVGIVGRTGAGKSSIMTALFRLVEPTSGSILIDGQDITKVGLSDLRSGLAIIPQDALLFSGTLRTNLDPFNKHDDVDLWDALKRSYLVDAIKQENLPESGDSTPTGARTPINKFTLDSVVEDEGTNLSVGQRSLVSLARALVRDSKIIIMDEATASVDYETDRNIQDTIASEFNDRTILCIAHRLRTIISYDRICVLDAGHVAEFDSPARLFENQNGIFRTMCDRSNITLDDIRLAAKSFRDI